MTRVASRGPERAQLLTMTHPLLAIIIYKIQECVCIHDYFV